MTIFILTVALLGQYTNEDIGMMRAQEDWVIDNLPKPKRMADHLPPQIYATIMLMGDDCFRCRDRAKEDLRKLGPQILPYLFWSLRSKDEEIKMRSRMLILELARCSYCDGTTKCKRYWPKPVEDKSFPVCLVCGYYKGGHDYTMQQDCHMCEATGSAVNFETLWPTNP